MSREIFQGNVNLTERGMLGITDKIGNTEIRSRSKLTDVVHCAKKMAMGGSQKPQNR